VSNPLDFDKCPNCSEGRRAPFATSLIHCHGIRQGPHASHRWRHRPAPRLFVLRVPSLYRSARGPTPRRAAAFRRGLQETGFIDGENLAIDYRYAEDQFGSAASAGCRSGPASRGRDRSRPRHRCGREGCNREHPDRLRERPRSRPDGACGESQSARRQSHWRLILAGEIARARGAAPANRAAPQSLLRQTSSSGAAPPRLSPPHRGSRSSAPSNNTTATGSDEGIAAKHASAPAAASPWVRVQSGPFHQQLSRLEAWLLPSDRFDTTKTPS
jgi:hypothetical protein